MIESRMLRAPKLPAAVNVLQFCTEKRENNVH